MAEHAGRSGEMNRVGVNLVTVIGFENTLLLAEDLAAERKAAGLLPRGASLLDPVFAGGEEKGERERFVEERHYATS
jgi:hypothetical protein